MSVGTADHVGWLKEARVTDIVLVGGGHAHVHVIRAFGRRPEPGARLTLVSKEPALAYSGMLPGVVAGRYRPEEALIDLGALCRSSGARMIHAEVVGLDREAREVALKGGRRLAYDFVSLDVGIMPDLEAILGAERAIAVKPISTFLDRFEDFRARALRPDGPRDVAVAGGGAAGVELAMAVAARLRRDAAAAGLDPATFRFALIAGDGLLPTAAGRLRRVLRRSLAAAGVALHEGERLVAVEKGAAVLADGVRIAADAVLVAASAAPHPLGRALGLPLDPDGFVAVDPTLASTADPRVFAVGDCAEVIGFPRPKAGVFAARHGPPLARNLRRAARGLAPNPYRPRERHLQIIGRGDGTAVAAWGPLVVSGRAVWRLKDLIDRRWVGCYRSGAGERRAAAAAGRPA